MRPEDLRMTAKAAAQKSSYAEAVIFLQENLESNFVDLGVKTMNYYLPRAILALPKAERRPYINGIPEPHRAFVINGISVLWKRF